MVPGAFAGPWTPLPPVLLDANPYRRGVHRARRGAPGLWLASRLSSRSCGARALVVFDVPVSPLRPRSTCTTDSQPQRCSCRTSRCACVTATYSRSHPRLVLEGHDRPIGRPWRLATPSGHRKPARAEELPSLGANARSPALRAAIDWRLFMPASWDPASPEADAATAYTAVVAPAHSRAPSCQSGVQLRPALLPSRGGGDRRGHQPARARQHTALSREPYCWWARACDTSVTRCPRTTGSVGP